MRVFNHSKYFVLSLLLVSTMVSCGNNSGESGTSTGTDNNPSAIDTTQHPNGVTSGSVISTDTSAMSVDSFVDRKKDTTGSH